MCSEQRADSILQDRFAQLMLQKDMHPTKCFWLIQEQKTTRKLSSPKTLSLTQEVSERQIRWNLERHSEKTLPFSWLYTFSFFFSYSFSSISSLTWPVGAELNGAQSDWLCLSWCSWCFWSHVAGTTWIPHYTDSVLHMLLGWQDLPLWQKNNP